MRPWKLMPWCLLTVAFCLILISFLYPLNHRLHQSVLQTETKDVVKHFSDKSMLRIVELKTVSQSELVNDQNRVNQKPEDKQTVTVKENNTREDSLKDILPSVDFKKESTLSEAEEPFNKDRSAILKNQTLLSILKFQTKQKQTIKSSQENVPVSQWNQISTISYPKVDQEIPEPKNLTGSPRDNMLRFLEDQRKSSKKQAKVLVPNIVHYVWLSSGRDLKFHEVLGILSAQKYLNPDVIKLHCDKEPTGKWWSLYKNKLTSLKIVNVDPKIMINGMEPSKIQVKSDILRMRILQREGGIYLDFDVIAIQSFDDLRKYEFTLGLEYHGNPGRVNNGIIIAALNARFFKVWFDYYKDFKQDEWDVHSCAGPYYLAPKYPSLIHVDENHLNYPSGLVYSMIYNQIYDWTKNYAMHLWYNTYRIGGTSLVEFTPEYIKTLNSTFGQLARRTFYGSPKLILGT